MSLLPPTIAGPISECNVSAFVNGIRTGATISIFANETAIGGGTASFPEQLFQLTAPLSAGQLVHARQELGGEISPPIPFADRTQVQPAPSETSLSFVHLESMVYNCGNCLQISSAVPGARVRILSNSVERGAEVAVNGAAHINLSPATNQGDVLEIVQEASGLEGPGLRIPAEALPGARPGRLPSPRLTELRACDEGFTATNLIHGAHVIAERSSGPTHFACAGTGAIRLRATPAFQEGETVRAHQEFLQCEQASDAIQVSVMAATPVLAPSIFPKICAGATRIRIRSLRVGAMIHIFVDGTLLGDSEAVATAQVVQLPSGLSAGSSVTAAQTLCGILSDESAAVEVTAAPEAINTPSIPGPLNACSPAVMVQALTPGGQVMIRDRDTGAPRSDSEFVTDDVAVIRVSPALRPGETLVASVDSCGVHRDSDEVTVEPQIARVRPPQIVTPVFAGANLLEIIGATPGATVELSVDDLWLYSFFAPRSELLLPVDDLAIGMSLRVRQRLCSLVSAASARVAVRGPGPRIATESPLPEGEVGVPYNTVLSATGGVTPLTWSTSGGLVPGGLTFNSATGILAGTPQFAGYYEFTVAVRDNGSPPITDERSFKMRTRDGATAPPTGATRVDIWNCHTDNREIRIWTQDLSAGTGWQEKSTLASQRVSGVCPPDGTEPGFQFELTDGHSYLIAAVDPDKDGCPNHQNDPTALQCLQMEPVSIAGSDNGVAFPITVF